MNALTYLQYALQYFRGLDIPCRLSLATAEYPMDMLIFPMDDLREVYPEESAAMTLFFARPDAAFCKELQMQILHLTAYLGKARGSTVDELRRYFGHINVQLPLGSFDVDADGNFYYRYNLPVPDEMEPEAFLRQTGSAYAIMQGCMGMFLIRVAEIKNGTITAEAAVSHMREDTARMAEQVRQAMKGEIS